MNCRALRPGNPVRLHLGRFALMLAATGMALSPARATPAGAAESGASAAASDAQGRTGKTDQQPVNLMSYADLVDLADYASTVLRVTVRATTRVEAERAAGLRSGYARLFVEARAVALLAGPALTGESVRYLLDVPLDAKGKLPKRGKGDVILFARMTPGRPGELQLVAPDAQIAWNADTEARLKGILAELLAPDAPPRVGSVQEAIYVPGTLAGEGETQLFLNTANMAPASITVAHRPGESPRWSVSFSEVLDSRGEPPARETLPWYRLACFLPEQLEPQANVSATPADQQQAAADYALVRTALGECRRMRGR